VLDHSDASTLRRVAQEEGTVSMRDDGLAKAIRGVTSVEEVDRMVQES